MSKNLRFILGGSRSGKSAHGEAVATELAGDATVIYIATCRTNSLDAEMRERIDQHQRSRPDHWLTLENQFDLEKIATDHPGKIVLLDCLTLWLSHWSESDATSDQTLDRLSNGLLAMKKHQLRAIIVSNEIGTGLIPPEAASRAYRDLVGLANQLVARSADRVDWLVAGIPVCIKPGKDNSTACS